MYKNEANVQEAKCERQWWQKPSVTKSCFDYQWINSCFILSLAFCQRLIYHTDTGMAAQTKSSVLFTSPMVDGQQDNGEHNSFTGYVYCNMKNLISEWSSSRAFEVSIHSLCCQFGTRLYFHTRLSICRGAHEKIIKAVIWIVEHLLLENNACELSG